MKYVFYLVFFLFCNLTLLFSQSIQKSYIIPYNYVIPDPCDSLTIEERINKSEFVFLGISKFKKIDGNYLNQDTTYKFFFYEIIVIDIYKGKDELKNKNVKLLMKNKISYFLDDLYPIITDSNRFVFNFYIKEDTIKDRIRQFADIERVMVFFCNKTNFNISPLSYKKNTIILEYYKDMPCSSLSTHLYNTINLNMGLDGLSRDNRIDKYYFEKEEDFYNYLKQFPSIKTPKKTLKQRNSQLKKQFKNFYTE